MLPSLNEPVAVKACTPPTTMPGPMGLTAMLSRTATTENFSSPVILLSLAVMVIFPLFNPVTMPLLLMDAMLVLDELQLTFEVRSFELPSL